MDIVCIGLIIYDVLVKPVTKEALDQEHYRVEFVKTRAGGDAFNVASALSKLGNSVALMGKVGNDGQGRFLLEVARERGIDTGNIVVSDEYETSTSIVMIHPDTQRTSLYYGGASDGLCIRDIDFEKIKGSKILCIGSALALKGLDGEELTDILKFAKEHGVTTLIDLKGNLNLSHMGILKGYLPYTDIIIPNLREAGGVTGMNELHDMAGVLAGLGAKTVVIKNGVEGCYIYSNGQEMRVPAFKVNAVDTTGAGDSFVSGFVTGYYKGLPLYECGRLANAVGALSVQQVGATDGVKPLNEVIDFINDQK